MNHPTSENKMNNKKRRIIGILLLLMAILLPIPGIFFRYRNQISFVPPVFLEEYLKFFGSLVAVFIAFFLVDVFWASEKGLKQAEQIKKMFIFKLETIHKLVLITKIELAPKDTEKEAIRAEEKVLINIKELCAEQKDVLTILNEHGTAIAEDKKLEAELFLFLGVVSPLIRDLNNFDSIRPASPEIDQALANIENQVKDMLNRIGG